ncbi:hypothetical protein SEPL_007 [Salmonella phage SE_PL]|nr:hypothetical protein 7t3_0610 [Salmonella phage 7t3]QIG62620.1 hypothetical protein SEPL_007 [Salmonella phage SE_PL]
MRRVINFLTFCTVSIIMIALTLMVGFIPLALSSFFGYSEIEMVARLLGCVLVIPMLRLTFKAIDYTFDKTH